MREQLYFRLFSAKRNITRASPQKATAMTSQRTDYIRKRRKILKRCLWLGGNEGRGGGRGAQATTPDSELRHVVDRRHPLPAKQRRQNGAEAWRHRTCWDCASDSRCRKWPLRASRGSWFRDASVEFVAVLAAGFDPGRCGETIRSGGTFADLYSLVCERGAGQAAENNAIFRTSWSLLQQ